MLRMAHQVLSQTVQADEHGVGNAVRSCLRNGCEVVICDNLAAFFYEQYQRAKVPVETVAVNIAPPFTQWFMEWPSPGYWNRAGEIAIGMIGVYFEAFETEQFLKDSRHSAMFRSDIEAHGGSVRWVLRTVELFTLASNGVPCTSTASATILVGQHGECLGLYVSSWDGHEADETTSMPALMALSFMNCKNVSKTDATVTEGPPEKWLRRQKLPKLRYHVLDITPMKDVLHREGGIETNGIKKALHICRGHFATYTEDKPLFGNFVGTVWKPSHVRGDIKHGAVVKDYSVTPPE